MKSNNRKEAHEQSALLSTIRRVVFAVLVFKNKSSIQFHFVLFIIESANELFFFLKTAYIPSKYSQMEQFQTIGLVYEINNLMKLHVNIGNT